MKYTTYAAEYKMAMVEEYLSRDIGIRTFANEKGIGYTTFLGWLRKVKAHGKLYVTNKDQLVNNQMSPIEVTNEVRTIVKEETRSHTFSLTINDITLTFNISNLKEVLEVIRR